MLKKATRKRKGRNTKEQFISGFYQLCTKGSRIRKVKKNKEAAFPLEK